MLLEPHGNRFNVHDMSGVAVFCISHVQPSFVCYCQITSIFIIHLCRAMTRTHQTMNGMRT